MKRAKIRRMFVALRGSIPPDGSGVFAIGLHRLARAHHSVV